MSQEFLYNALNKLQRTRVSHRLEQGKGLFLNGVKKGFFGNENIEILVQNADDKKECFKITTTINDNKTNCDISFAIFENKLNELNMFNSILAERLNKIKESYTVMKVKYSDGSESYDFIELVALTFKTHISVSFPGLEEKIKIITENRTINFLFENGFDANFHDFFENGVLLKAAVNNCKKYGVEKLFFYDMINEKYIEYSISELEKFDLA